MQAPTEVSDTAETALCIVDYDIPERPSSKRREFYRRRSQLYANQHKQIVSSTASVLVCRNSALAKSVYELASKYGKAHLYRVFPEASNIEEALD